MMKKRPVAAEQMSAAMRILHLCLARKACFLSLVAWVKKKVHFCGCRRRSCLFWLFFWQLFILFLLFGVLCRYFRSWLPAGGWVASWVVLFCLGLCCCWRTPWLGVEYHLVFVDVWEGSWHVVIFGEGDFLVGEFLFKFFPDFFKEGKCSFNFEGTFG